LPNEPPPKGSDQLAKIIEFNEKIIRLTIKNILLKEKALVAPRIDNSKIGLHGSNP
jgi:hypothetical protein